MNRHEGRAAATQSISREATDDSRTGQTAQLYEQGQNHLAAGNHSEALRCYLQALELTPGAWDLAFRCAVLLYELKQYEQALSHLDRCLNIQPQHAITLYMRARTLRDMKRYGEAILASELAEALDPTDADVFNNAGIILQHLGRDEEAMEKFDRAIWLRPGFVDAICNKANSLAQAHKFEEAFAS